MTSELLSWAAVLIALSSVIVSYRLLRLQRDPEVVVYAVPDYQRSTIINLVIENTGKGAALDVQFTSNRDIPSRAFGFGDANEPKPMDNGILINGITSFLPGEKRIITWGQYGGLKRGLGDGLLDITATYSSKPPLRIWKAKHRSVSQIDIRSFEGTDGSDKNWEKKSAEQLQRIADTLSQLAKPLNLMQQETDLIATAKVLESLRDGDGT